MKPPMNNKAELIFIDKNGVPDRHGKYPVINIKTEARVRQSTKVVFGTDGTSRQSKLEVDLPPINLEGISEINALDNFGVWHKAQVIDISDATNFAGNRIFYRTILCE